nr:hypothetical protein [Tanacetum cinerariifolium]
MTIATKKEETMMLGGLSINIQKTIKNTKDVMKCELEYCVLGSILRDTPDEVKDSSNEEVESTDEEEDTSDEDYELELKKKSNSKGGMGKQDWKRKSPFYFSSDEESGDADTKGNHLVEIQADDHDLLVNSDNENDDMLGYESEKYFDAKDAAGNNHSDRKLVKRGITRLYKFRREYGRPGGIKIKKVGNASSWSTAKEFHNETERKIHIAQTNRPSKLNELPTKYSAIVKAEEWVEFVKYTTTDAYKEKSARGKMVRSKNVYHYKMGRGEYVFMKEKMEKRDYARGVGSRVTYKSAYEVDGTQSSVVVRDKDARIQKKSNGLVTSEKEPVKTIGPKKTPKSRQNGSPDSQSQGICLQHKNYQHYNLKKSNIVALGTVYKSDRKQMLHKQALPNDCYKVSIDSSLVDASCIPDVGNNGLKTVKDGVDGFFAWPKNQVVLDEEVTPPTMIQKISDNNSAPKSQSKSKNYVSRETMQRQARKAKSQMSLNYGS